MSRFAWPCRAHRNPLVYCCESGNQIINVVALLLLFYCIIHGPPGSVLLVAVTAQQQPCCDLSPLCLPQTVLLCACLCLGAVYVPGMCAWRVGFHNVSRQQQHRSGSSTTPAVFSISCLCSSSHGVCVWLMHGRRSNHGNMLTPNATTKHTSSDLVPGIRSIRQKQNQFVADSYHLNARVPLFDLRRLWDIN